MKISGGKISLEEVEAVKNMFKLLYVCSHYRRIYTEDVLNKQYKFESNSTFANNANNFINSETELSIQLLENTSDEYKEIENKVYKQDYISENLTIKNIYKISNNKFDKNYVKNKKYIYGCHAAPLPNTLNILCNNFDAKMIGATTDTGYYGDGIYFHNALTHEYCDFINKEFLSHTKSKNRSNLISFILVCKLYYDNYAFQTIPINLIDCNDEELKQDIQSNYDGIINNDLTVHEILFKEWRVFRFMSNAWYNGEIKNSIYCPNNKLDLFIAKRVNSKDLLNKTINEESGKDDKENEIINELIEYIIKEGDKFENIKKCTVIFSDFEDCNDISDYKYRFKRMIIILSYTQMLLNFKKYYYETYNKLPKPNEIVLSLDIEQNKTIKDNMKNFIKDNMEEYDPKYYNKISEYIDKFIKDKEIIIYDRNYNIKCEFNYKAIVKNSKDFLDFEVGLYALYGIKGLCYPEYTKDDTPDEIIVNNTKLIEVSYLIEVGCNLRCIKSEINYVYEIEDIIEELDKKIKQYTVYN